MSKAHILFIDLDVHRKTGSADFFVELLRREFAVDICYVASRYDRRMPTSLIQEQTYLSSQKGREHWEEVDAPNVIAYIEKAIDDYTPMYCVNKLLWWLMLPWHFSFDIWTWVRTRARKLVRS